MVSRGRLRRVRRAEVAAVLGGSAVLAGSWVVAVVEHEVPGWEARLFEAANGLPDALWPMLWPPMQLGSLGGAIAVAAATVGVSRDRRLTLATLASGQAAWWSGKVVKELVSRGRPSSLIAELNVRENAGGFGYVSGHAAVSFALAAVLAPSLPRPRRPVAFGLASLVAFARVYSGAHLPLDVVGGAGLGVPRRTH